jgi:chemosensory pili system protein ChpC
MAENTNTTRVGSSTGGTQRQRLETVHCLLLPLNQDIAVLPNAAVAEVTSYAEPEPLAEAPDWYLGKLTWRDRRIPLISYESASGGEAADINRNCRIAVLNTLNGNASLPYIAIVIRGLPSLQVIKPDTIKYEESNPGSRQSITATVNINGTEAIVPDIDDLETRILRLQ